MEINRGVADDKFVLEQPEGTQLQVLGQPAPTPPPPAPPPVPKGKSDWQNYDGLPFPKTIDITRPQDEYAVVLTVVKMEINRGVADDKFVLEQPEGTQLQVLGQHE